MNLKKETETQIQSFSPAEIRNQKAARSSFSRLCDNIAEKFSRMGRKDRSYVYYTESAYKRSVKNLWNEFRTQILGGIVTAAVVVAVCALVNLLDWSLGYEVIIDGENVGMVLSRETVFDAIDEVREEVKLYLGEDEVYEKDPAFVRRIVAEDDLADKDDIKTALLSNVDTMVEGYALYINDKVVLGVSSAEAADWVLASYKQKYAGTEITEDTDVEFRENVEIKKEFLHIALLETPESALNILSGDVKELTGYTVQEGDTLVGIADKFDISVERILALNEELPKKITEGMEIKVEDAVPLLSVRCIRTVSLTEPVPFEVEKIKDDTIYEGKTVISREGKDGTAKVLARVTTVNGVETNKEILESETLAEPVKQIEKIGTKERPSTTGSGSFVNPTFGTLSSRYGLRWDRSHNGIDIAGAHGSEINAADGGVVTYADWMSGYGNYVVIDHENGYQTAYGHCSAICVKVGDRVAKGELIAKMGNTGRSTGTHLHFEVKKNGEFVNPLEYVGY